MRVISLILFIALCSSLPMNCVSGQGRNEAANARSATSPTGYHGPVKLGPFSIKNKVGGIDLHKFWFVLGQPFMPKVTIYTGTICYHDRGTGTYLIVVPGADDPRLVRGLTLSRINVCPERKIYPAGGFSTWSTGKGIRLGASAKDVVLRYGKPSSVWDRHTDRGFTDYPVEGNTSHMTSQEHIMVYLPREGAPDTSYGSFGVRNGVIVWMTVSDNE